MVKNSHLFITANLLIEPAGLSEYRTDLTALSHMQVIGW
jgi:hypothetical protein